MSASSLRQSSPVAPLSNVSTYSQSCPLFTNASIPYLLKNVQTLPPTKGETKMGQRHQLFAVAKANGTHRTLAVTHHQWLFGYDVIKRCFLLLEIFRADASGVSRELRRAATLDWAKNVPKDKIVVSVISTTRHSTSIVHGLTNRQTSGPFFPFIANTLFLGTANGGLDGGGAFVYLLSLNTTPGDCINGDCFTVFDISDPNNPRWAFFVDSILIGPWEYFEAYTEQQHANFACREKMFKLNADGRCRGREGAVASMAGSWTKLDEHFDGRR